MKIALAQLNPIVGDLEGNARKILEAYRKATAGGAELVVYSELVLTGYPPLDLLGRPSFVPRCEQVLADLATKITRAPALIGTVVPNPAPTGRPIQNVVAVLGEGRVLTHRAKSRLPTYDVFDEDRYFEAAGERRPLQLAGRRVGVTICEDIWPGPEGGRRYNVDPIADLAGQGIDLLVNLSASPFHAGKGKEREELVRQVARRIKVPALLCNQVGGNDSLLFDGRSVCVNADGKVIARAEAFREDLIFVDLKSGKGDLRIAPPEGAAEIQSAIVMGLRDFMDKCGFGRCVLGLSGGIDSAVVAALATEAVGPANVQALAMPSGYSSPHSRTDAIQLAKALGIGITTLPITPMQDAYKQALRADLGEVTGTLTEENLQARIRGALIMSFANATGALALATGNKSELATGYCTLYGDMVGGLAPIGDLRKAEVYQLAAHLNRHGEVIPRRTIERPPSAELRPDQKDQDTLPAYEILDPILDLHITEGLDQEAIVARGFDPKVVGEILRLVELSEFKRRQAAPVLRVTRRAFGEGRRIPIARGLRRPSRN